MSYTISKRFDFSASHQLTGLPDDHQCARLHGHNYTIEVELGGDQLDGAAMLYDYGHLDDFKRWLDATLDHRHLNDVMPGNPTAENLANWLCLAWLPRFVPPHLVRAVRVYETPKTCAEYRR